MMTDVLIRGLAAETVKRYESEAAALGISRNEIMVRRLEADAPPDRDTPVTWDWDGVSAALTDLSDPDVMERAWR